MTGISSVIEKEFKKSQMLRRKDDTKEIRHLAYLLKKLLSCGKHLQNTDGYSRLRISRSFGRRQLCLVKMRYDTHMKRHLNFLHEYMVQADKEEVKEKPELFSKTAADLAAYEKQMDNLYFKFIVSPDNQNVDIQALVKNLMKQVSVATGYDLLWVAAEHTNTDHRHAHILVNGKDKKGQKIHFSKSLITQTMRDMACTLCTQMVGPRSREEIIQNVSRVYGANRLTEIDVLISQNARRENDEYEESISVQADIPLRLRLAHLEQLGLAVRKNKRFYLEKNWKTTLKAQGRYNSFLRVRKQLHFSCPVNLQLYTGKNGTISGTITGIIRMDDEENWNNAIVVENRKLGCAWYIPLRYEADAGLKGKEVCIKSETNHRGLLQPKIKILSGMQM